MSIDRIELCGAVLRKRIKELLERELEINLRGACTLLTQR